MTTHDEPIRPFRLGDNHAQAGNYYANVAGINGRHIVGIYFDRDGNIIGHTIRDGSKAEELIARMVAEVTRRGIKFPDEVQA